MKKLFSILFALLLAASLFFYAWGEPWFVLVMMGSILANYCFGLWVHAWRRRGRSLVQPVYSVPSPQRRM